MAQFADRLRELRKVRRLSQRELADVVGLSKSSINMYERAEREPCIETLKQFATYFEVDMEYLLGVSPYQSRKMWLDSLKPNDPPAVHTTSNTLPLLGEIACGTPIYVQEELCPAGVYAPLKPNADFCLRCKGDSMINARIFDGDIVFIKQQPMVENGDIAAVIIGDEATLKRVCYFPQKNMIVLKPENPKYEDLIFTGQELSEIRILGKAVAFQSSLL